MTAGDMSGAFLVSDDAVKAVRVAPAGFLPIVYSAAFLLSLGGGFVRPIIDVWMVEPTPFSWTHSDSIHSHSIPSLPFLPFRLCTLPNSQLSGKTSFIAISFFAGTDCNGVESDACTHALNTYTAASGVTTFVSLGVAWVLVPFLSRLSDVFGRRRFIQIGAVMSCWPVSVVLYQLTGLRYSSTHAAAMCVCMCVRVCLWREGSFRIWTPPDLIPLNIWCVLIVFVQESQSLLDVCTELCGIAIPCQRGRSLQHSRCYTHVRQIPCAGPPRRVLHSRVVHWPGRQLLSVGHLGIDRMHDLHGSLCGCAPLSVARDVACG